MTDETGKPCQIDITGMTHDGRGVGRTPDGVAVFIPGVLPGDRARVRIVRSHTSYTEGVVLSLEASSPDRVNPFCPDFGRCGGCSMQHMSYPAQLVWKRKLVVDALTRIGKVTDAESLSQPTLGMEDPMYSRYKVALPVRPEGIGFFARSSHRVIPFTDCQIQHPAGIAVRKAVLAWMEREEIPAYDDTDRTGLVRHLVVRTGHLSGEVQVTLVLACADLDDGYGAPVLAGLPGLATEMEQALADIGACLSGLMLNAQPEPGARILGDTWLCVHGSEEIEETLDGLVFRLSPASFFQVNPAQAERLYRTAAEWAVVDEIDTVYDLYCGTGTISCYLARRAPHVVGIESEPSAIRDAVENATRNGLADRVRFVEGRAEQELEALLEESGAEAANISVVLDPPRRGCDPRLLDTLARVQPERIVYVSCEPSTLARDLRRLTEAGYLVKRVQPVDMFPWTEHVETVVLMSRGEE